MTTSVPQTITFFVADLLGINPNLLEEAIHTFARILGFSIPWAMG